jgi:hypothetical protein
MIGKRLFLAPLFVVASAVSAYAADITGTWTISSTLGPNPSCTFGQTGNFFTGLCKGPGGEGIAFGIVGGQTIRWAWHPIATVGQNPVAFDFVGKLDPDTTITGTIMSGNTTGQFIAKKQ